MCHENITIYGQQHTKFDKILVVYQPTVLTYTDMNVFKTLQCLNKV